MGGQEGVEWVEEAERRAKSFDIMEPSRLSLLRLELWADLESRGSGQESQVLFARAGQVVRQVGRWMRCASQVWLVESSRGKLELQMFAIAERMEMDTPGRIERGDPTNSSNKKIKKNKKWRV